MDEYKSKELMKAMDMISPFQKVIDFFIVGFIVSTIQFDVGYLPILSTLVSLLCFYLGLRMVRKENKAFFWAYVITIILMIKTFIQAVILATTMEYPSVFYFTFIFLKFLQVILICSGLKQCIPYQKYPMYILLSYVMMQVGLWIDINEITLILFMIGFISLLYHLLQCQKYLVTYQYQLKLAPIKIGEKLMSFCYIGITVIIVMSITVISPFLNYEYVERTVPEFSYHVLDYQERSHSDSLITQEKEQVTIYEYDQDHYLYVYHFQFTDIQQLMTSLVVSVEQQQGNTEQVVQDIWVGDGNKQYQIQSEKEIEHRLPPQFNSFGYANDYYVVDVSPLVHDLDITISILVNKNEDSTQSEYNFVFYFQNGFGYPYSPDRGLCISRGFHSINGSWGYHEE
ncbi:hypothetical protein [Candidatus Stoquefichus massiliensis]|uniref:hypothetical protein n=1 Tax=Candidatus Stoquefichus massiliensis TaxID=1470350 RepID=UPI0004849205|nr:hypothetical protein [Candidatus Stoquefichus massiliensis]